MNILETTFRQRAFDEKWERLAKVPDPEHYYHYTNENGDKIVVKATKWITIGVYDYLFDMEE